MRYKPDVTLENCENKAATEELKYCEKMFRNAMAGDLEAMCWCYEQLDDRVKVAKLSRLVNDISGTTGIPQKDVLEVVCRFDLLEGGKFGFSKVMGYLYEE